MNDQSPSYHQFLILYFMKVTHSLSSAVEIMFGEKKTGKVFLEGSQSMQKSRTKENFDLTISMHALRTWQRKKNIIERKTAAAFRLAFSATPMAANKQYFS